MRTGKSLPAVLFMSALFCSLTALAQEPGLIDSARMSMENSEAAELYNEGKYEKARAAFMRAKDLAGEEGEDSRRLHYNIGTTFYKEGNYEEAEKEFNRAAGAGDPELREKAFYNLGNVYFKKAMQDRKIETLEKAVEYYQKALELNQENEKARFNIEVVRRHLDMKQQQQQKQSQSREQKSGQQEQQQAGAVQKEDEQGKEDREKEQEEGEEKEEEKAKQEQSEILDGSTAAPQPKKEQVKPSGSKQAKEDMTEEEARRLLQAVKAQEEENLEQMMKARARGRPAREKDW